MLLKVVSVIFIIFGAIATIISIIELTKLAGASTGWVIASIILLLASVIELIVGFIGLKKSDDRSEASFFIVTGAVLSVLTLISMIIGFSAWGLIAFALPVLYIVGGYMLRNSET